MSAGTGLTDVRMCVPVVGPFSMQTRIIPTSTTRRLLSWRWTVRGGLGAGTRYDQAIQRGAEWIKGMQSRNGGWAAFDVDNTYHYLNNIPFADHGALIDPPTEDVTARCVSMLAQLGETLDESESLSRGVAYLLDTQLPDGSWYGRWGLNYIYGTWSTLCALNACGIDRELD